MSTHRARIRPETVASETAFDYDGATPTGATATHQTTLDDTTYMLQRTFSTTEDHITCTRRGRAGDTVLFEDTTQLPPVPSAGSTGQVPGDPQSFVGLVMAVHYESPPHEQLHAVVQAAAHD